jgi:DNA-binding transcriptional MocR family regulator
LDRLADIGVGYNKPRGGVYVWCRLPDKMNGIDVAAEANQRGVSVVPGEVFYPRRNGGFNYLRLNYSYESIYWLSEGMNRLVHLLEDLYDK